MQEACIGYSVAGAVEGVMVGMMYVLRLLAHSVAGPSCVSICSFAILFSGREMQGIMIGELSDV